MELIILGSQAPFPGKDGACSGYLLRLDGADILIDCGSGVLARLPQYIDYRREGLQAVFLSHFHHDHISDFWLMRYALAYSVERGWRKPLPVWCPSEPTEIVQSLEYTGVVLDTLQPGEQKRLAGATFTFFPTDHPLPCLGMRVETDEGVFVYTADTAFTPDLVPFCQGADILLAECSLRPQDSLLRSRGHMTSEDAGKLADLAGAKTLLLTHFWPDHSPEDLCAEAQRLCACSVYPAAQGSRWKIKERGKIAKG